MPLRVHGVTLADALSGGAPLPAGLRTVAVRDLAAVVSEQPHFMLEETTDEVSAAHAAVVEALFGRATILPAPPGLLFRGEDVLSRWLGLHYGALSSALSYVEDRVAARVHICRRDGDAEDADAGTDLAEGAGEAFRALRRKCVAAVPLRVEHLTGILLSGAFLVERELWQDFASTVKEEQERHGKLRFDLTGPWPPYDFVQLQFGG